MRAVFVGTDRELEAALRDHGVEAVRVNAPATGETLAAAGIDAADLLIVTDVSEATAIPVALDVNPRLRVVVYAPETMPEFVRGQVDLAVAPGVLAPDVIAEELVSVDAYDRSGVDA